MKKEYTIDNFQFIGDLKQSNGIYTDAFPCDGMPKWDINLSSELTELIQSAGRFCERYASDLFITWGTVEACLLNGDIESETFIFGIRENGVDHADWVIHQRNKNDYGYFRNYYRKLYMLKLERNGDKLNSYFGIAELFL